MTKDEMIALFHTYSENYVYDRFKTLTDKPSQRRDLCALIRLDQLLASQRPDDMVCAAEHDQIWLDVDLKELARVVTEQDIDYLNACGVWVDDDTESLSMFV